MKAIILAAGMGTRLKSIEPKPLTVIHDEITFLDHQVRVFTELVGRDNIVVVLGYKYHSIMERYPDLMYVYNQRFTFTGAAKSLLCAVRKFAHEDILWTSGDIYFEAGVIQRLLEQESSGCVVIDRRGGEQKEIGYTLNVDGNIAMMSKELAVSEGEVPGILCFRSADVECLKNELESIEDKALFIQAVGALTVRGQVVLKPVPADGFLCEEIDDESDLEVLRKHLIHRE